MPLADHQARRRATIQRYRDIAEGQRQDGEHGRLAFCVSTTELGDGKGDLYVALVLAAALNDAGWGITMWPAERYDDELPADIDIAIVMIESFVPGLIDRRTRVVAWVRNWGDAWASLPYLHEFAAVWCSSEESAERIRAVFEGPVVVVPIATDPVLMAPVPTVDRTGTVLTTANFWGVERGLTSALATLAERVPVTWFGRNGEHLRGLGAITHRLSAPWESLDTVYSGWQIVVDDLIPAAARYGNQNSRLFDALACGAMVITNERRGLSELGLDDVPVYSDGDSLVAIVEEMLADPHRTAQRAERLRMTIIKRHTASVRAASVADHLELLRPGPGVQSGPRQAMLRWATRERETSRLQRAELDRARAELHALSTDTDHVREGLIELERQLKETQQRARMFAQQLAVIRASRTYRTACRLGDWRARLLRR